jgi:hypothetical protein
LGFETKNGVKMPKFLGVNTLDYNFGVPTLAGANNYTWSTLTSHEGAGELVVPADTVVSGASKSGVRIINDRGTLKATGAIVTSTGYVTNADAQDDTSNLKQIHLRKTGTTLESFKDGAKQTDSETIVGTHDNNRYNMGGRYATPDLLITGHVGWQGLHNTNESDSTMNDLNTLLTTNFNL